MKRLMKLLVRMTVLLVIAFSSIIVYRLWDKGELKNIRESDPNKLKALLLEESEVLSSQIKENSQVIGAKLEEEWSRIPWEDYKSKLSLDDDQWDEFKKSMDFLKEKPVASVPNETLTTTEKNVDPPSETTKMKVDSSIEKTQDVMPKQHGNAVTPVRKALTQTAKNSVDVSSQSSDEEQMSSPYPFLSQSNKYKKAMTTLEEAKSENRQGLGMESSSKKHLKKAVSLYRKCQTSFMSLSEERKLNGKEKAHLERLLEEIGKQIYWGSKLGTLY